MAESQQQLLLDWFGGALEHVPLGSVGGCSVETLRAVLLAVYRLPERAGGKAGSPCWAGQVAIAAEATRLLAAWGKGREISERTARRALAVLERELQYLVSYRAARPEARTRKTLDHYVIQWTEVGSALDRARGVTRQPATRPAPATRPGSEQGTTDGPQGAWPVDQSERR